MFKIRREGDKSNTESKQNNLTHLKLRLFNFKLTQDKDTKMLEIKWTRRSKQRKQGTNFTRTERASCSAEWSAPQGKQNSHELLSQKARLREKLVLLMRI